MNKTLLTGKPYVPAVETDLKKTFQRIRKEMKEAKPKEEPKSSLIWMDERRKA